MAHQDTLDAASAGDYSAIAALLRDWHAPLHSAVLFAECEGQHDPDGDDYEALREMLIIANALNPKETA